MTAKINPDHVVWESPESLQRAERERVIKAHRGSSESLIEKLDRVAGMSGRYVRLKDPTEHPEAGLTTRIEDGVACDEFVDELLVCVGEGEYEVYDPEKHGEDYSPLAPELRGAAGRTVEK